LLDPIRDAQKNRRASRLYSVMRGRVADERTIGPFLAIKKRLNCDNRDVANNKPFFSTDVQMVLNVLTQTMPGNSARKRERCKRSQKKKCWKSKAATGPMLPRDLYSQPESPWPYWYCGRYGCSAGSFYPVGVIGEEVEAVFEVRR
jgi:hypothetical protein